jgi:hypothetical protein
MPGKTNAKLKSSKNNLRFDGIVLKISMGSASGLGNSEGKKGIIGSCPIVENSISINDPKI